MELPRYEQTTVCFVHVVGRDVPLRQVRDHDNIKTKQIIDVLSTFVLLDDNGLLCETHQWTECGDSSRIFITLSAPAYYGSREMKELGQEFVKVSQKNL